MFLYSAVLKEVKATAVLVLIHCAAAATAVGTTLVAILLALLADRSLVSPETKQENHGRYVAIRPRDSVEAVALERISLAENTAR